MIVYSQRLKFSIILGVLFISIFSVIWYSDNLNTKIEYKYKYIISYSPTINSSLRKVIKDSENYISEIGSNFNKNNVQKCIKKFNFINNI